MVTLYSHVTRVTELERTGRDREHLQQLYNDRGEEMTSLRSAREKLSIQLEEREKNFLQLQQQHDRMAEVSKVLKFSILK